MSKLKVAVFSGDPAGIGPELTRKLLNHIQDKGDVEIILIGQQDSNMPNQHMTWHQWSGLNSPKFNPSEISSKNGTYMLEGLTEGVNLVSTGQADAFCFAPLNKSALRLGGMHQEDELRWFEDLLQFDGICGELNVLENLWTARVTSHVALKDVSNLLTKQKVANAIEMIAAALRASGKSEPRIAVCGLNPHNGDNGNYGDEESKIITPGIEIAKSTGFPADGPFPADTAFVRAIRKDGNGYDGVVTMYHDQGQIAMKLMGFEKGVTVHGGLPIPITTPAHGTAYDIVGKEIANPLAMINAFELACRMGQHHKQQKSSALVS